MNIVKKRYITGYAIFSLFFFLALFAFTLLSIQSMTITNRETAEKDFLELRNKIVLSFAHNGDLNSNEMEGVFKESLKNDPRLLALVLYSNQDGPLKVTARDRFYLKDFNTSRHSRPYTLEYTKTPGTRAFELPLTLRYRNMEINAYISGFYVLLGSNDYTVLLWHVLYILLGFLVITVIVMIFISAMGKVEKETVFPAADPKQKPRPQKKPPQYIQPQQDKEDSVRQEYTPPRPVQQETDHDEVYAEAERVVFGERQQADFLPETGMGAPGNYLNRLRFELERSAAFDQDLAVAMIKIRQSDATVRKQVAGLILKYFPFQDLAFEYSADSFAVIIPDEPTRDVLDKIHSLQTEAVGRNISLSVGVSSRNMRSMSAEVLSDEARDMLAQADMNGSDQPVVAHEDGGEFDEIFNP